MRFQEFLNYPKNIKVFFVSTLLASFLFYMPFLAVYLSQKGISTSMIAIFFAAELAVTVLLEIPTGIFADRFGNKKARILGLTAHAIAIIGLYFASTTTSFFAVFVLLGIGYSFFSGTQSNMIYEALRKERRLPEFKKVGGFISAIWPLGAALSFAVGGFIVQYSINATILCAAICLSLALFVELFFLDELKIKKKDVSHKVHLHESFKKVWTQKTLVYLFIGAAITMAFIESMHVLNSLFFAFKQIPIENNGWIFAVISLISAGGFYYSHKFAKVFGNKKGLIITVVFTSITQAAATLFGGINAALVLALSGIPFGFRGPIIDEEINSRVNKQYRATVHSLFNMTLAVGMAIFAPIIGYMAQIWSINTAFLIGSICVLVAIPFYVLMSKRKPKK